MRFTNYIWDFDGMLFNAYPRMCNAFESALSAMGYERPQGEVMPQIKISVRGAASHYAEKLRLDAAKLLSLYHEIEHNRPIETMLPYDGAERFLRAVIDRGGRHFLYTHRDHTALDALKYWHLDDCFSGAVTADDAFPSKPAPDALCFIMTKHDIAPQSAVMLGDRDIDIQAAHNAGIAGCLVDPEHYYDAFETPLRCERISNLFELMEL